MVVTMMTEVDRLRGRVDIWLGRESVLCLNMLNLRFWQNPSWR